MKNEDPIIISFDNEKETLDFHYLMEDRTNRIISSISLDKLKKLGLKTASYETGEFILSMFNKTRDELFG